MKIDEARKILASQAIEQSDPDGEILSELDRREAGAAAGAPLPGNASTRAEDAFLAERAELLLARAETRSPDEAGWIRRAPGRSRFAILAAALCLAAGVLGYLTNELGPERRVNILSIPLIGILLWSLLVYVREVLLFLRKRERLFHDGILDGVVHFLQRAPRQGDEENRDAGGVLGAARTLFASRWNRLTAPIYGARIKSLLHTVALVLAVSAVLGMYVRGLPREYRAVWESTFFTESAQLRPVLRVVLGPAAALTGSSIPSVEELDAIHLREESGVAGENAARWIHWYAITIGIFVAAPRLLLASLWRWRAARLARTLPYRGISPGYFDHLLATSSGSKLDLAVVPYALSAGDDLRRDVRAALETRYERPVEVSWRDTVSFGDEEEAPELGGIRAETVLPLFDFSATPEKESHLAFLRTLSKASPAPVEMVLLDTGSFDRKTEGFPDARKRRADREAAWRVLLADTGIEPLLVGGETTRPRD